MPDRPFSEEFFPNSYSKPLLMQLEANFFCSTTYYLRKETDPCMATIPFRVVLESDKVIPEPLFPQAKKSQLPQLLILCFVIWSLGA